MIVICKTIYIILPESDIDNKNHDFHPVHNVILSAKSMAKILNNIYIDNKKHG